MISLRRGSDRKPFSYGSNLTRSDLGPDENGY
jgi:hypothetical protein